MAAVNDMTPTAGEPLPSEKRTRFRRRTMSIKPAELVSRVLDFYETDLTETSNAREARLQRYAKFRGWVEGKDWPWENASDVPLVDMQEKSLRQQDTLHNAVMSQMPPVGATATNRQDRDKQDAVDKLISFQVFTEQDGEEVIGDLIDAFTNDGDFVAFVPWITEKRESALTTVFPPIPQDVPPDVYFRSLLRQKYANARMVSQTIDGWDYTLEEDGDEIRLKFYTRRDDAEVEMVVERDVTVYDGPRIIPMDWEDVLTPPRAANLQIPGPSNPGGASHVILVSRPHVDEIARLVRSGFYDMADKGDVEAMRNVGGPDRETEKEVQKDDLQGEQALSAGKVKSHRNVTRLMCFDTFDIDNDGIDEDVVVWLIKETKTLLRVRRLTEVYPLTPPRRPLVSRQMIPVRGRRHGVGLLEQTEGIHDVMKMLIDQTIDNGTIRNAPFFFYRPSGGIRPETIRLWPGEGYPLSDPQRDVQFPQFQQDFGYGINMLTLLMSMEEKATQVGDMQHGRVPAGKSQALRTIGGMAMLMGQGEARPERILRRFFSGLAEIWELIHAFNRQFLPGNKQILITGLERPSDDPYLTIENPAQIDGEFVFTFKANVFNTSKQALQESIGTLMQTYVNPLLLQAGITDVDGIYRLLRDFGKALGQDPDRYLKEPSPGAMQPGIFAQEAIHQILNNEMPDGRPAEGAEAHLQTLMAFTESDEFGLLRGGQIDTFKVWLARIRELYALEQRQAALARGAQQFAQAQGGGQPGAPTQGGPPVDSGPQQISGQGELIDKSMPTAGSGATGQ